MRYKINVWRCDCCRTMASRNAIEAHNWIVVGDDAACGRCVSTGRAARELSAENAVVAKLPGQVSSPQSQNSAKSRGSPLF